MLFFFVLGAIGFAVGAFGGVLPSTNLLLTMMLIAAGSGYLVYTVLRNSVWHYSSIPLLIAVLVLPFLLPARQVLGFVAGACACAASQTEKQTLRFFKWLLLIGIAEAMLG